MKNLHVDLSLIDSVCDTQKMKREEKLAALDHHIGIEMAYFSELSSTPEASRTRTGSEMDHHIQQYSDLQQHLNPAYLAWRSLASASEHAGFAEHMRYVTTGGVVMRPQSSLGRVSLLGAARALFVLRPDDPKERQIRSARLANQESKDAQRMLDTWGTQVDMDPVFLSDLEDQTRKLADAAAELLAEASLRATGSINEVSMLKKVVEETEGFPIDAEAQALALWNRLSGVSHARSWIWSTPYGTNPRFDFLGTWTIPTALMTEAWRLWNLRRGDSTIPHLVPDEWQPNRERWGKTPV